MFQVIWKDGHTGERVGWGGDCKSDGRLVCIASRMGANHVHSKTDLE